MHTGGWQKKQNVGQFLTIVTNNNNHLKQYNNPHNKNVMVFAKTVATAAAGARVSQLVSQVECKCAW